MCSTAGVRRNESGSAVPLLLLCPVPPRARGDNTYVKPIPVTMAHRSHPARRAPPSRYLHPSLRLMRVVGKGEGYQATSSIAAGELLIREQAHTAPSSLLHIDKVCAALELAYMLSRRCASDMATLMSPGVRIETYMSYIEDFAQDVALLRQWTREEHFLLARSAACVQNNSFERVDDDGEMYMLPGFWMAKINHSCTPNSTFARTRCIEDLVLLAITNIQAGEEITISYIQCDPAMTTQERRNKLLREWHFMCACELCTVDAARL